MIFGTAHIKMVVGIGLILSVVFLAVILTAAGYRDATLQEYTALKQKRMGLTLKEQAFRESLKNLSEFSDDYAELPQDVSAEASRATIIAFLEKLSAKIDLPELDFQFYDRVLLPVNSSSTPLNGQLAIDSLLIGGQINHMDEFYKMINYMSINTRYYEFRGCDIKRSKSGERRSGVQKKDVLKIRCMISWYSVSEDNI